MQTQDYTHGKDDIELLVRALHVYAEQQASKYRYSREATHARELAQLISDGYETVTRDTLVPQ